MRNSFITLVNADRSKVVFTFEHRVDPTHTVVFGSVSCSRLSGDIEVRWSVDCPFTFVDKLKLALRTLSQIRKICA